MHLGYSSVIFELKMEHDNNNSPLTTLLSEFSLANSLGEFIDIEDILNVLSPTTTKPQSPSPPQPYRIDSTATKGELETDNRISQDEGDGPAGEDEPTKEELRTNRLRAAHNMYEKKRRKMFNEKLKALQSLVPNSRAKTTADMLDDIITYMKAMQHQLEVGTYLARATAAAATQYQYSPPFCIPGLRVPQHSACVPLMSNPALLPMARMYQAAGFPTTSFQAPTQQWMPSLLQGDGNLNPMPFQENLPPSNLLTTLPSSSASSSSTMPPPFPYSFSDACPPSYRG